MSSRTVVGEISITLTDRGGFGNPTAVKHRQNMKNRLNTLTNTQNVPNAEKVLVIYATKKV